MQIARNLVLSSVLLAATSASFAADAEAPVDETWNAYAQATYIWHHKNAFQAAYTNFNGSPNSLLPSPERSYTTSATLFLGWSPWRGGELYAVPELISEVPLSDLHGLGGSIQNGELEKNGSPEPTIYRSRLYFRQSWGLGGETARVESGAMQLAGTAQSRRIVFTAGNLSVLDIFDRNAYAGDVRQQFLGMDFLTHASYDFGADARGYSWGVAGEYYHDDWVLRAGRFIVPRDPNQLQLNYSIMNFHGDQVELEHRHSVFELPGKLRLLIYRNVANMGRFGDAINALVADPGKNAAACTGFNYGSSNAGAPDLCWVRKKNAKTGVGINLEQSLTPQIGVFVRAMKSDGNSEVYAYTSADSSLSFGVSAHAGWNRPQDTLGLGYAQNRISGIHQAYLAMGGIDGFIGDGKLNYKAEQAIEAYYNINLNKRLWITLDYQRVDNPAFNADRGPVNLVGARAHLEY